MSAEKSASLKVRAVAELKSLAITTGYFWLLLSLFALHRAMILQQYHINFSLRFGFALINALILAKFMWLAELFHAGQRAEGKSLLYSALWNSAIFAVILLLCHVIEDVIVSWYHTGSLAQSLPAHDPGSLGVLLSTGLLMFVVLIPFFLAKGLIHILGKDRLRDLLLRPDSSRSSS